MGPDLVFALELADAADAVSLPHFGARDLVVETKPDLTPVTEADRAVEREVRRLVADNRPGEGVLGEELGEAAGAGDARWIVDPIDGTRNFSRGIPVWATLIALERAGRLEAAVVCAPALGRRWWAARGTGAFAGDGERLHVSAVERLEDACVTVAVKQPVPDAFRSAWHLRGFGDFWAHVLVAEGAVDVAVDAIGVTLWDLAAPMLVVEEAGGRFTDLDGHARADGGSAVASNGLLHDAALAATRARASRAPDSV
jgi:histidinol-phosphatase